MLPEIVEKIRDYLWNINSHGIYSRGTYPIIELCDQVQQYMNLVSKSWNEFIKCKKIPIYYMCFIQWYEVDNFDIDNDHMIELNFTCGMVGYNPIMLIYSDVRDIVYKFRNVIIINRLKFGTFNIENSKNNDCILIIDSKKYKEKIELSI
jgi:hypothetical protein